MKKKALIIFTRVPMPGQTKTRLMPYYMPEECAGLHRSILFDLAEMSEHTGADVFVYHTPNDKNGVLHNTFRQAKDFSLQIGEDLGERMYAAIRQVLERGYASAVLIGTDIPEITSEDIADALELLETKDIVFGPTADGGYYLVGMNQPHREVFEKQTYGHGSVLENTLHALEQTGFSVGCVRVHQDIDTREDLAKFREKFFAHPELRNSHTGRYIGAHRKISVIVPIYNEESTIRPMLEQLRKIKDRCEILLVDGGSTDRTREIIGSEFKVLQSEKGRAKQMNLGAQESCGDILFFLHCDSELPKNPLGQIQEVMKRYRWGCFGIAFHSANFFMFTCRVISNHRIRDRKVVFGDQGIFVDRELFFEVGMYPELPLMEDYQFSLTMKERGEKIGITKNRIYTSDRRFPKGTIPKLREMWKMNRLRKKYRDGIDIETIADMYGDVR